MKRKSSVVFWMISLTLLGILTCCVSSLSIVKSNPHKGIKPVPKIDRQAIFPHDVHPKAFRMWISTKGLTYIRSEPSVNAPIILEVRHQSIFPVIRRKGKWYRIQTGLYGYAWIADWVCKRMDSPAAYGQIVRLSSDAVLKTGPDSRFPAALPQSRGTAYVPIEVSGAWTNLFPLHGDRPVWVRTDQILSWSRHDVTPLPFASLQPLVFPVMEGKTVVIDPGHGGRDPGATGIGIPVRERDINLAVALALESKLKAAGVRVLMTRTDNETPVSLHQRTMMSNQSHADAFVSIHQNMFAQDPSITGTLTYYYNAGTSRSLARDIEKDTVSLFAKLPDQHGIRRNQLYVLHHNRRPAVLIEGCFMSNLTSLKNSLHPAYDDRMASGIFHGLLDYFKQKAAA